jgi:hypothetical protein
MVGFEPAMPRMRVKSSRIVPLPAQVSVSVRLRSGKSAYV